MISDLTPETEYGVQVCQPELGVCGNCEVTFSTPAAQGTYILHSVFSPNFCEGLSFWLVTHN